MTPLDLTRTPPRAPRAEVAGTIFLARSIDKVRASLPGGALGDYALTGFTTMMLERLGISLAALTAAVRDAAGDDDVAAFVRREADPAGIAAWNDFVRDRPIYGGDRDEAIADHPWLAERPDLVAALDFLDADDRRAFPA